MVYEDENNWISNIHTDIKKKQKKHTVWISLFSKKIT